MSRDRFADMVSILNFGLGAQNKLTDLNKLVSERVRKSDFGSVQKLFDELLAIAQETDERKAAQSEQRLQKLRSEFARIRIEMLKEAKLLNALRQTNDIYTAGLEDEIEEANKYLKGPAVGDLQDAQARADVLKKRIQELHTTKAVGDSFSQQIKLTEDNLVAVSDRIWDVLMNLIPLIRGRLMVNSSREMTAQTKKLIMEYARDYAEKTNGTARKQRTRE